ncbi:MULTISPECIES: carbohydrate porin [unclassified Sphingomonas]|jgi:high affinity Mn2+ porin|nr:MULTISPECIES: carbohydrate porin [unclassified Sphingomonas]
MLNRLIPIAFTSGLMAAAWPWGAIAQESASPPAPARQEENWAVHGQATLVTQGVLGFRSPYDGPNSLTPRQVRETIDATVYVGMRPWRGGELWINPEIDQGFGLSDTLGVAGFPSAEAYKVGKASPYLRLQRFFVRQVFDLGGAAQPVAGAPNQLAGKQTVNRLVVTIGKFGVGDAFDTNRYAHDPRGDFLNWAIVDTGTFDYAADAWGYSTGAAVEWYQGPWTLRAGAFNLSKVPNGETLERNFSQYQLVGEIEHRHEIAGHAGAVRLTLFRNHGRFGRFDDALALASLGGGVPDTSLVRRRMTRSGVSLNVEQEVTGTLGLFARAGIADGAIEPYDFTDIDRTVAVGGQLDGRAWGRGGDAIGFAAVVNAIAASHQRYLRDGGIGLLVGDGRLPRPGQELIGEAYYDWQAVRGIHVTLDYQFIAHPAYNRDRGPANVVALRLHGAF